MQLIQDIFTLVAPLSVQLEVLLLPEPSLGPAGCGPHCPDAAGASELVALCREIGAGVSADLLLPPVRAEELAWYRWIIGHQATFLGWRSLRAALARAEPADAEIAGLLELYSVLLLYSGSCSPEVYATLIRPRMMDCHPAFSGEWAPDYRGIPAALRRAAGRRPAVRSAMRLNQRVHAAVAERLVPQGGSLLQQAGRPSGTAPSPAESALYDQFFLTRRAAVCEHVIRQQFLNRLLMIVSDLDSAGLYHQDQPPPKPAPSPAQPTLAATLKTLEGQAIDLLRRHLLTLAKEEP
jgi:L-tyrosine peroxygenase